MIYVIGIGSGSKKSMTLEALETLEKCEIILGYKKYVELIKNIYPKKLFKEYSMRQEKQRCEDALKLSNENKIVGIISSGDSGIYGMAGLMLEIADEKTEIKIIPGISASSISSGILGAPLMNDYGVISLSDLLTSWEVIERRLRALCEGDFVICIFNPSSKKRFENFKRACEIMLEYKDRKTPCGIVRNGGREGENSKIITLNELQQDFEKLEIDMFCTVIIGNSQSIIKNGKFITRRGY